MEVVLGVLLSIDMLIVCILVEVWEMLEDFFCLKFMGVKCVLKEVLK